MIDEDDFNFVLLSQGGRGVLGILLLILLIVVGIAWCNNEKECSTKSCAHCHPALVHHECVCLEKPLTPDAGGI